MFSFLMREATPCSLFNGNRKGRIGKGCNLNFAAITQEKTTRIFVIAGARGMARSGRGKLWLQCATILTGYAVL
jgi:hypothetical protein